MLNAVLLFLHHKRLSKDCYYAIENIFLYHTRLSKVCFYAVVKISLKFIAIVNFQHTILSCFTFTVACLFYHFNILNGSSCSIIKASCSRFTVHLHLEKFTLCSLCLIFTVTFCRRVFYISHFRRKYLSRIISCASNGSFNPYIITNKEGHMVNLQPTSVKGYKIPHDIRTPC